MSDLLEHCKVGLHDRYMVDRLIGTGGMATVLLAQDRSTGRDVAIKVLSAKVANRVTKERFHREVLVGGRLAHDHIVPVLDGGDLDGLPYFVMPYLPDPSLRDRIDAKGRLPVSDVAVIADQVGSALAFAHERGIIHRDIKPDNILFTEGRALVADFGVAVVVNSPIDERLTLPGEVLGTPAYMSPEQAMGRWQLDRRSDVYSLGCVLYETLVGHPPFSPKRPEATIVRRLTDPAPVPSADRDDIPSHVDKALEKALAWHPDGRFESVTEFVRAFRGDFA